MSWHPDLQLEIVVEFIKLTPPLWMLFEERVWRCRQRQLSRWAEYGRWWARTTLGRKHSRSLHRRRRERLTHEIVGHSKCVTCGRVFEVNAMRRERGTDKTCSARCRVGHRRKLITIDGVTRPLMEWADRAGIAPRTVHQRLKLGWDIRRALSERADVYHAPRRFNQAAVLLDAESVAQVVRRHPGIGECELRAAHGWWHVRLDAAKQVLVRGHNGERLVNRGPHARAVRWYLEGSAHADAGTKENT